MPVNENTRTCLECEQEIQIRTDGTFVMHAYPGFPVECQGSRSAAYAPTQGSAPIRANGQPEITRIRDAEIRVFDREPGTDDASDMYVLEVLGVTVRVRLVTTEGMEPGLGQRTDPYITVEAGGTFTVSVNEDPHTYNDGA